MKNRKAAGISLVALVITIIVLIILTGAVIVTFMEGGIIDRAKEAVFKNDMRTYQEILALKRAEEQLEMAIGTQAETQLNASDLEDIQEIIPEFKEEYEGIVVIVDGIIMLAEQYEDVATEDEQEWLSDLVIEQYKEPWDNSHASVLVISEDGVLAGFKEEIKTYAEDGNSYTVPEEYTNLVIPEGVNSIATSSMPTGSFQYCINLKSVSMPDSVTEIQEGCFFGCSSLSSIRLSNNITEINSNMFVDNTALTTIEIPNGVTIIDMAAFLHTGLTSIEIPNSVTRIKAAAFGRCDNLRTIIIPSSVNYIEAPAFLNISSDAKFTVGSEEVKTLLLNCGSNIAESQITIDTSIN